jgi:methyl-accepting chemotaxis protein
MESITAHMNHINQLVNEINNASHEQSAGINQVNIAMTHIGEATHINAGRVSRSEQTAGTLREKGASDGGGPPVQPENGLTDTARGTQQQVTLYLLSHNRRAAYIQHHPAPGLCY